jgi:hypothetical protein
MQPGSFVALVGLLAAVAASGCDSNGQGAKTVTVDRQVTVESRPTPRKPRHKPRPSSTTPAPAPAPEFVYCDSNIRAKVGTTTCPFAENAFWTYWTSGESGSFTVWSPAAHATFATRCDSDGVQVTCTTTDDGAVKFKQASVDRYSQSQADAYAGGHDLGPDPYEALADGDGYGSAPGTESTPADCHPDYGGCLDPDAYDYDCAGGSGNGPDYTNTVEVKGADPFGLDADGDGWGCD